MVVYVYVAKSTIIYNKNENTSKYIVKKPAIPNITAGQNTEGQPSFRVGLLPLRPYMGNVPEIELPVAYVMYLVKVNPQMEKLYVEFTSSIILAPAGSVPLLAQGVSHS